jgi:hypothetical protein
MFVYVRARAHEVCPGYDTVVRFVLSDARNIRHSRKYTKSAIVAIFMEQREYYIPLYVLHAGHVLVGRESVGERAHDSPKRLS